MPRARLMGLNHVALEVGDIDEALAFYGRIFGFTLRGRGPGMAFLDMGDQFLALYRDIQFTKAPWILRGMGLGDLEKSAAALAELETKGLIRDL